MNSFPIPLVLFFPLFAIMWLGISALLAFLSGWQSLALRFAAPEPIEGERFRFVTASMGPATFLRVNYASCLVFTINDDGVGMSVFFPFSFQSPPLFFPWAEIQSVQEKPWFFGRSALIRIRGSGVKLTVCGRAAVEIAAKHRARAIASNGENLAKAR